MKGASNIKISALALTGGILLATLGTATTTATANATTRQQPAPVTSVASPSVGNCLAELGQGHDADVFAGCNAAALKALPQPRAQEREARELRRVLKILSRVPARDRGAVTVDDGAVVVRVLKGRPVDVPSVLGPTTVKVSKLVVERSEAELLDVTKQLADDPRLGDLPVVQFGPIASINAVRLVVQPEANEGLTTQLQRDYGPSLVIERQATARLVRQQASSTGTTRFSDANPWSGGLALNVRGPEKIGTGGLPAYKAVPPGTRYMTTAGHLTVAGGTPTNDYGPTIGRIVATSFAAGGDDAGLIESNTTPCLWVGHTHDQNSKRCIDSIPFTEAVGEGSGAKGDPSICTDGKKTGEVCAGLIESINQCILLTNPTTGTTKTTCGLTVLRSTGGEYEGTLRLSQGGDSGGPLYQINQDGSLYARGDIVGGAYGTVNNISAYRTAYTPARRLNQIFNTNILTMHNYMYSSRPPL